MKPKENEVTTAKVVGMILSKKQGCFVVMRCPHCETQALRDLDLGPLQFLPEWGSPRWMERFGQGRPRRRGHVEPRAMRCFGLEPPFKSHGFLWRIGKDLYEQARADWDEAVMAAGPRGPRDWLIVGDYEEPTEASEAASKKVYEALIAWKRGGCVGLDAPARLDALRKRRAR